MPSSTSSPPTTCALNDHVFVVHSQDTLENKRPPEIDNKTLARQKRRRTRYASYYTAGLNFEPSL